MWFELSSSNEQVAGQGNVEQEVLKGSVQSGVPRTSLGL